MNAQYQRLPLVMAVFVGISLIFAGCAQHARFRKASEDAFESRRFDDALAFAVNSLYEKPEKNEKAQNMLELAWPRFTRQYEEDIDRLKLASSEFRGEETLRQRREIISRYEKLVRLSRDVENLPPAALQTEEKTLRFQFKDYSDELAEARGRLETGQEDAALMYYNKGKELHAMGGLENSRAAANSFKKCMEFVPDFRDAGQQYELARKDGTIRIAILPFENRSGQYQYGAVGEMITDKIVSNLFADRQAMEFMEVIDREQLNLIIEEQKLSVSGMVDENSLIEVGKILGVHEVVTGRITQIISDRQQLSRNNHNVANTIKVKTGTRTNADGKEEDVYANREVKAQVTTFQKSAGARMSGSFRIVDIQTARILETRSFTETYQFNHKWATHRGDQRAVTGQLRNLLQTAEKNPLSDGERVVWLGEKLANTLSSTIKKYAQ